MWPIADIDDHMLRVVRSYQGLLAFLIWNPMHRTFGTKVRRSYTAIHRASGSSMVILAGRSDWVSPEERAEMQMDIEARRDPRHSIGFALGLTSSTKMSFERSLTDLAGRFQLRADDLPALVFVNKVEGDVAYVFKVPRDLINSQNDEVEHVLLRVFETVSEIVEEDPCHITPHEAENDRDQMAELEAWRDQRMQYLIPELQSRQLLEFAAKHSGKLVGATRLLAPFLG